MNNSSTWLNSLPDSEPSSGQLVGLKIDGRYLIEKKLGHGGVGAVYLARDLKLHEKLVVIKVLLEKSAHDNWVLQKFLQEKEALARVDHPAVVGILDTGELPNGQPYIAMQFVDGVTLRDAIKETPEGMDLERVASIIRQTSSGLNAVHSKKIFHRDLKPENIMLQQLGRGMEQVKIVDFGIAKIKESVIAPSTITGAATAGTIVYMSPEQLHGIKVTAASDIYSFGIIAYEMITGRRPFHPATIAMLSDLQRQGVRVKPSDLCPRCPVEVDQIILKALSVDPNDRYQNAGQFGDALADALLGEGETLKQPVSGADLPPTVVSARNGSLASTLINENELARVQPPEVASKGWLKKVALLALAIFLVVGAALVARLSIWSRLFTTNERIDRPNQPLSTRSLTYSLTVQKMRDGKPYQEPFQSSGQEIFENGYKFRLNVSSPQSGYLYVFNEGTDDKTAHTSFNIIYPTPETNQGSPKLDSSSTRQTNWNTFSGQAGTELFWMIWSASPVAALEAARDAAFKDPEGEIKDVAVRDNLKEFLAGYSNLKPETIKDTARRQTTLSIGGDTLVKLIELEHR